MKIESLAIIFILIILPITIVLSEYSKAQAQTLELETLYDSRLITATHDALKTFQINTFNDTQSDIADSKINSIEASINSFYNSMESSFGLQGYSKDDLKTYTPALVYTMYDGYYIYSPYTNIANTDETTGLTIDPMDQGGKNQTIYGVKPYVYYSCRYKPQSDNDSDFIITYSLDNYISISGMIDGKYVKKSGYLISLENLKKNGNTYFYNGTEILQEASLSEKIVDENGNINSYKYVKINGIKYYWDEAEKYIFYVLNGTRIKQATQQKNSELYEKYITIIQENNSAINYYKEAYEFTNWLTSNSVLRTLKASDAVNSNGNKIDLSDGSYTYIFKKDPNKSEIPFEYPTSNFNEQRKAVIRHSIEINLSVAIANFNKYSNSGNDFQMPKLKETEWELLYNKVSIISFLQGLSIGGKVYNGHTVVTNEKTEEVVQDDDIYITTKDGYYHRVNDKNLDNLETKLGVLSTDFEIRKNQKNNLYYLHKDELGAYTSIVNQEDVNNKFDSIYEYLKNTNVDNDIKQLYYTALGRERWGTYKTENISNIGKLLDKMFIANIEEGIVLDGLIRYYDARNNTENGHSNSSTTWKDLSGHYDGEIKGGATFSDKYLHLDGVDDWVNCGVIDLDYTTLTIKVEMKSDAVKTSTSYYLLGNWETDTTGVGILIRPTGRIHFTFYEEEASRTCEVDTGIKMEKNKIYDITGTYDGNEIKLYIDGNCVASKSITTKIKGPLENTVLGIGVNTIGSIPDRWSDFMSMNVHNVMVYDRALTQNEIRQNLYATK